MEYLNEYFGYDRNLISIKQEVPLNLTAKNPPPIQRYHPYIGEKIPFNDYKYYQNQEVNLTVSRRSVGSPSCSSDSESSISSSTHERLTASPVDMVTNGSNNAISKAKTIKSCYDPHMEMDYQKFREEHLTKLAARSASNLNMKRMTQSIHANDDPTYREKREKNNLAAKKSRDARKQREDEMVVRCAFLESELMKSSLMRKQDKVMIEEETLKMKELDVIITQQIESINEFQKLIFQLKSNNNLNTSLSV